MAKKKKTEEQAPAFEEALAQLQEIVASLEEGTLGLEESLQQYERATGLIRHCNSVLETAEQKIEQLTGFDQQGQAETLPFDATATHSQKEQKAGRRKQGTGKKKSEPDDTSSETSSDRNLF